MAQLTIGEEQILCLKEQIEILKIQIENERIIIAKLKGE